LLFASPSMDPGISLEGVFGLGNTENPVSTQSQTSHSEPGCITESIEQLPDVDMESDVNITPDIEGCLPHDVTKSRECCTTNTKNIRSQSGHGRSQSNPTSAKAKRDRPQSICLG